MYDQDVFTVLTAWDHKNKASSAFKLPQNSRWLRPAVGGVAEQPTINSREATPAEDLQSDDELGAVDRLIVTFSELMENPLNAIQAGTNPTSSHILLGHRGTKGVSARQYNIAVDDNLWNQREVRRKETWILAYSPGIRNRFGEITIHSGGLAVKIEFPNHQAGDPQYVANLRALVKKCKEAADKSKEKLPGVEGLGLDSEPATQASSEAPTPGERLIYYKNKSIGEGTFGEVYRLIKARDGKNFAAKTFNPPVNKNKRELDEVDPVWLRKIRREFTIMRDNPHPNAMQVFEFRETPEPMIIMAYYPHGNIEHAGIADEDRFITAFGQILDGLKHLHAKAVVHRDLKPENFLIETGPFFKVVITDFGLAKVATDTSLLKTFCGSLKYAAPEVFPGISGSHGSPVDVWSLGVIVLEWIYGIPKVPQPPKTKENERSVSSERWHVWLNNWCTQLLNQLKDQDDDQVIGILLHTLEFIARKRWSANKCLAQGFGCRLFKRRLADGLVVCIRDPQDLHLPIEEGDDGTMTPTQASMDPEATEKLTSPMSNAIL